MRTRHYRNTLPALAAALGLATLGLVAWTPVTQAQQPRTGMTERAQTQPQPRQDADRDGDRDADHDRDAKNAGQSANGADQGGQFSVHPETMNFGNTPLFLKRIDGFTVRNHGNSPIRNLEVEVTGGNASLFSVDNGCGASLAPGQQCGLEVTFEPTTDGDKTAEMRVTANGNDVRTRRLVGVGLAARYTASPKSLSFGKVDRNSSSREQVITIQNTGSVNLPITATSLSGPNEKQFVQNNDCPRELEVGKSCKATVTFRPTFQGHHTATLTVWSKGGAPGTKVELQGTGS
jgi:hypothetical protein